MPQLTNSGTDRKSIGLEREATSNPSQRWFNGAKKDERPVPFASLMDFCHLEHCGLAKYLKRKESGALGTTSKTTVDTEQYSRIQLRKWQQRGW